MPRQTKHTKDKFLDAGIAVVCERGFDYISVADVAAAAAAPKGSFFNHFASKEDFGAELVRYFGELERAEVTQFIAEFDGSPLTKLRAMVQRARDGFMASQSRGCLVGAMAHTVAARNEACRSAVNDHFRASRLIISELIVEAQRTGEIDPALNATTLASLLQSALQGAMINAKSRQHSAPFDDILEILLKPR